MVMERLQKILARAGAGSRRACEEFILQGRVDVDGQVVTELGTKADPEVNTVRLDGEPVRQQRSVHYALYKPPGYVCSLRAERGRPRAVDLIRDERRLFTVGRLDEDSEGLIIVTNDGLLTQRLTHPRFAVPKEYQVVVDGRVDPEDLRRLRKGVYLAEGRTSPCEVRVVNSGAHPELLICIREGLNRQVRRMLAAVGLKVRRLIRVRIGPVSLGDLAPGRHRRLSEGEVNRLMDAGTGRPSGTHPERRQRPPASRHPTSPHSGGGAHRSPERPRAEHAPPRNRRRQRGEGRGR